MTELRAHLIGDIHMSDRHMPLTEEAMMNSLKYVRENTEVDFICVMGDIFDTHRTLKMDHRNKAIDFIKALSNVRPTIVLIGNHDRMNNRDYLSDVHPFYGMDDIRGRLYIVSRPRMLKFYGSVYVMFVPYVPPGKFMKAITDYIDATNAGGNLKETLDISMIKLICAHQEFRGVSYGPITSTVGDEWPEDHPMVVSGHIHHRHALQDNIYYTGSLYPVTMDESMDKGIITMTYDHSSRKFDSKCTRVVSHGKRTIMIDAKNDSDIREMINLERPNARYIITGTQEEVAAIKERVKGTDIKWVPDIVVPEIDMTIGKFDDMIRKRVNDEMMLQLLEEVMSS